MSGVNRKYRTSHKIVGITVIFSNIALLVWILSPYFWYPLANDIDTDLVIKEADKLFAQCEEEANPNEYLPSIVWVEPSEYPYMFSLYERGRGWNGYHYFCKELVHIPMWRDWWIPESGIYVLQEGRTLSDYLMKYTGKITDRVYWWNDDAGSGWASRW